MLRLVTIHRHERVAIVRGGAFIRLLGPGRHWVWLGGLLELIRYDLRDVVLSVPTVDPLPDELPGTRMLSVEPHERIVVRVDGVVRQVLGAGRFRLWTDVRGVELTRHDVWARPEVLVEHDRLDGVSGAIEATSSAAVGLVLCHDGVPVEALPKGRYRTWSESPWSLRAVPLGLQTVSVAAQDVLTADQVPVRMTVSVAGRVVDALAWMLEREGLALVYSAVQLALREVAAARDLDALVSDRDALSNDLLARARAVLPALGFALEVLHVKDVILSAEVKALVNRVTLARKEAEAHAIQRREEVASTRQLANTAKLLTSNPVLLRLKELELMAEIAGRIDKLVVVGDKLPPGLVESLEP